MEKGSDKVGDKRDLDEDSQPYDGYESPDRKTGNPPKMAEEAEP